MSPTKSTSSSLAITNHKLIPTLRGVLLVYDGHVFTLAWTNQDRSSWRCTYYYKNCPARLHTIEKDRVICAIVGEHSAHLVDPDRPSVLEYRQYLMKKATTTQDEPKDIIESAYKEFGRTISSAAGMIQSKNRIIRKARQYARVGRPAKPSSSSSLAITDHKLISTSRGISLVYKGHVFSRANSLNKKSYWRCNFSYAKCPAKLYTIEDDKVICAIVGQHSAHKVVPNVDQVLEYKQYLRERATTTQDEPQAIIDLANAQFVIGSTACTEDAKRKIIRQARKYANQTKKNVQRPISSRISSFATRSATRSATVTKAKHARSNILNKKKQVLLRNRHMRHQSSSLSVPIGSPINEIPDNNIQSIIQTELSKCILEKQKHARIYRLWSSLIGTQKTDRVQYVKLNIKESGSPLEWKPVPSFRAMQFEGVWDEPIDLNPDQKATYTIAGVFLDNQQRAKTFGYLFPNMKTLVIYFDLPDTESQIQNLIDLLSKCTKVESLSLIMSCEISSETTLPRICHTINTDVKTLKRLDLFVSDYEVHDKFHLCVDLFESIPLVTHLGLSCSPRNLLTLLIEAGSMNEKYRQHRGENHSLQSLSLQCRFSSPNMDKLFTANPEFSLVKRLQLTCVFNFDFVQNYLKLFTNVETLQLYACQPSTFTMKEELIEHLSQLSKLSELTLVDFGMVMDLPNEPACQLPTVKKFTIAAHDLFTRYRRITVDIQFFRFIDTIVHLFPALEELVLLAGEIGLPIRWKYISSELPKLFMYKCPTLQRVTINMKHPTLVTVAMRKKLHV